MITFLGPLLFNQWQSSMFEESIATSNLLKILMAVSSRSSLLTLSGTTVISKHSRLEYWLFPQHCLSNATTRSCSLLFTFFETDNSDSIFLKSLRSSLSSLLISYWIKCYQILLDIPKSMRSLRLLLVFLKQPQRLTYLLAKQAHLGTSAIKYSSHACYNLGKNLTSNKILVTYTLVLTNTKWPEGSILKSGINIYQ